MPRIARENFESGFFHIMIQGINKEHIFKNAEEKEKYLYLMKKYNVQYEIKIVAYCIMSNHAHFVIYTDNIQEMSSYMHKVNLIYATDYNKKHSRVGYVFRDRYRSQYIYDRYYLFKCIKYIHLNPVKAKIVKKEGDYLYSSYQHLKNRSGYINDELIQLIFQDTNGYINLFNSIDDVDVEVMDIENEIDNFEIAVNQYLIKNGIKLKNIKEDKEYLYEFTLELIKKGYKQKQIADLLEISPSKVSKVINKKNHLQNGNF